MTQRHHAHHQPIFRFVNTHTHTLLFSHLSLPSLTHSYSHLPIPLHTHLHICYFPHIKSSHLSLPSHAHRSSYMSLPSSLHILTFVTPLKIKYLHICHSPHTHTHILHNTFVFATPLAHISSRNLSLPSHRQIFTFFTPHVPSSHFRMMWPIVVDRTIIKLLPLIFVTPLTHTHSSPPSHMHTFTFVIPLTHTHTPFHICHSPNTELFSTCHSPKTCMHTHSLETVCWFYICRFCFPHANCSGEKKETNSTLT